MGACVVPQIPPSGEHGGHFSYQKHELYPSGLSPPLVSTKESIGGGGISTRENQFAGHLTFAMKGSRGVRALMEWTWNGQAEQGVTSSAHEATRVETDAFHALQHKTTV